METCEKCGARIFRAQSGYVDDTGDANCPEAVFHLPTWPDQAKPHR